MLSHVTLPLILTLPFTLSATNDKTTSQDVPILTATAPLPTGTTCLPQYSSGTGAKPTITGTMQGFNYDADAKDWETYFTSAANLNGQVGKFTSARLYSMIETNTTNKMIGAIDAAVKSGTTTLLLGLFADAGQAAFDIELSLLNDAIDQYQSAFTKLIYAISVGSEDFYRLSIDNAKGKGDSVADIQHYVCQTRQLLAAKGLNGIPVGHTDTWQMWLDTHYGQKILGNIDFVGMDDYPFWEYISENNAAGNLSGVYSEVSQHVHDLPVWITETGWPVSVPANQKNASDAAQPGLQQASDYWQAVGCGVCFGKINTWWYTFFDEGALGPSFGVAQSDTDTCGWFDLTCAGGDEAALATASNLTKTDGKCTYATKTSGAAAVLGQEGGVLRVVGGLWVVWMVLFRL